MKYRKREKRPSGYRSGFEEKVAAQLKGIKFTYEEDTYKYTLPISGTCMKCFANSVGLNRKYTPDFKIGKVYIESKGKFTSKDRTKMLAIKKQYPDMDLRMLFMANNKLNKNSTTRYLDWAKLHGYTAALGKIPPSWIKEFKKNEPTKK